jgi:hypothetical protein
MPLLEALPKEVIGARRRRQIEEWRRGQPVMHSLNRMTMAHAIGSPMSNKAMERATDDQIIGMLNAVHDHSGEPWRSGRPLTGGVMQLSQAFGAFAASCPDRALLMLETRLDPERHTYVAGAAIRELAKAEPISASRVRALIHDLTRRGFEGDGWHRDAAWAFSSLSERLQGLDADDVELLESWIVRDAPIIAEQTRRRLDSEARSEEQNARHRRERTTPSPLLFGRFGGIHAVPQRNHSLLAAIANGLLQRPDPDVASWVAVLERHLEGPEDPEIWATLLQFHSNPLWWVDSARAIAFFDNLWAKHPLTFARPSMVGTLWQMRSLISAATQECIVRAWLGGDNSQRQAAGEYIGAVAIVDRVAGTLETLSREIVQAEPSPARLGYIFSAAAAWREQVPELRDPAHTVLMELGPVADSDEAHALTRALSQRARPLPSDDRTREMLALVRNHRALLSAANGNFFLDALQELLLHPGFDADVLAVAASLAALAQEGERRYLGDGDLVQIAVALQRSDGPIRAQAMDVYEQLLDAEAYGAADAAEAALVRS